MVGPVLAAQMGYLPGTLWILAGAVFAGAIQDMTVLFLSTRRDGRSLGDIVRAEMGPVAGTITGIGILLICVIVLAVLALVVVKALVGSPCWSGQWAGRLAFPPLVFCPHTERQPCRFQNNWDRRTSVRPPLQRFGSLAMRCDCTDSSASVLELAMNKGSIRIKRAPFFSRTTMSNAGLNSVGARTSINRSCKPSVSDGLLLLSPAALGT